MKYLLTILAFFFALSFGFSQDTTATITYDVSLTSVNDTVSTITITTVDTENGVTTVYNGGEQKIHRILKNDLKRQRDDINDAINSLNEQRAMLLKEINNLKERRAEIKTIINSI